METRERIMARPRAVAFLAIAIAVTVGPYRGLAQTDTASTAATESATDATTTGDPLEQNLQEILEEREGPDSYQYDPQGRRDPFRSLIGPTPKLSRENAPPGPPGFMIDEIDIIGIVRGKQGLTAMVKGPDNNGYLLRAGEKVFDGEVIRVTPTAVVFRQEVNDPTRIERYREVVKELIPQAAAKR